MGDGLGLWGQQRHTGIHGWMHEALLQSTGRVFSLLSSTAAEKRREKNVSVRTTDSPFGSAETETALQTLQINRISIKSLSKKPGFFPQTFLLFCLFFFSFF